jgi:dolichol-phosphate mannosyltransferase
MASSVLHREDRHAPTCSAEEERPDISIIVPAMNEATNLPPLLARIAEAMDGLRYDVIVVDDGSSDGTPETCAALSSRYPVQLHVRQQPRGGLSGAVLKGFELARGNVLVVMDADLQHPPERLPALIAPLLSGEADFVLGSRHADGGSVGGEWGLMRRLNSKVATWLARPLAGSISDPMSGYFALRRESLLQAKTLEPLGYKIALELLCKCRFRQVREIPIDFGVRLHGRSKLTIGEQVKYLRHLGRLAQWTLRERGRR